MLTTDELARLREHATLFPSTYVVEDQEAVNAVWDALPELLRVYEDVLAAPEVEVGGADGLSCFIRRMGRKSLPSMQGQTVRLVPLATAKGESNG